MLDCSYRQGNAIERRKVPFSLIIAAYAEETFKFIGFIIRLKGLGIPIASPEHIHRTLTFSDQNNPHLPEILFTLLNQHAEYYRTAYYRDVIYKRMSLADVPDYSQYDVGQVYLEKLRMMHTLFRLLFFFNVDNAMQSTVLPVDTKNIILEYDGRKLQTKHKCRFFNPPSVNPILTELNGRVTKEAKNNPLQKQYLENFQNDFKRVLELELKTAGREEKLSRRLS